METNHQPATVDGNVRLLDLPEIADRDFWRTMASRMTTLGQARKAAKDLADIVVATTGGTPEAVLRSAVTVDHVRAAVGAWKTSGFATATINRRLTCLSTMGLPTRYTTVRGDTRSFRRRPEPALKWWLKPEQETDLLTWLARRIGGGEEHLRPMAYYIMWTTRTGLRVEETLRLERGHFANLWGRNPSVTIPGTKTRTSGNVTLPIGEEAARVAQEAFGSPEVHATVRLIPLSYWQLAQRWEECRARLGVGDNPLATLRAMRRSAARYLHVERGMPILKVKDYLRHTDIDTTMGYLLLTGVSHEELRTWL